MIKRKSPKEGKIIFSSRLYSFTLITTGVEALVMYYIKCIIYANFIHALDLLMYIGYYSNLTIALIYDFSDQHVNLEIQMTTKLN